MTKLFSYSFAFVVFFFVCSYIFQGAQEGIKLYQQQTISNPNGSGD